MTGIPGSAHDQKVYGMTPLARDPAAFFSGEQYILADSAYSATRTVVPIIKKPSGGSLSADQAKFNQTVSSARLVAEHTIGVRKMRWQSLRGLRHQVESPWDVQRVVHWIMACVVLHNLLLDEPDDDVVFGQAADEDDEEPLQVTYGEVNERGRAIADGAAKRNALVAYLWLL